jgi:hypothetical protein
MNCAFQGYHTHTAFIVKANTLQSGYKKADIRKGQAQLNPLQPTLHGAVIIIITRVAVKSVQTDT